DADLQPVRDHARRPRGAGRHPRRQQRDRGRPFGSLTMRRVASIAAAACISLSMTSASAAAADGSAVADAVQHRDANRLRALLAAGTDAAVAQPDGTTALHWAVHWDSRAGAKEALRRQRER